VRANTLGAIAEAAPAAGSAANAIVDEAVASLNDALRHPRFAEAPLRDQVLAEFALILVTTERGLRRSGAANEISALLEETLRVAKAVAGPSVRGNILRTIVEDLAATGQVGQAMRVAQDIETPKERAGALLAVAKALSN
jgi:hypothetical protein